MKIFLTRPTLFSSRCALFLGALLTVISMASVAIAENPEPVNLGTADNFNILAGSMITNTGFTIIEEDVGLSPGLSITGFPPGIIKGTQYTGAASLAGPAQDDLTVAYLDAAGRVTPTPVIKEGNIGGQTLIPGIYKTGSIASLEITSGDLTLDAGGDANAVWIFQIESTLTTASASKIILKNGAKDCRIFWQVGSSATLGTNSVFHGTIMAMASITLTTGAKVYGRALARNGAVTLDTNEVLLPELPILKAWYRGYTGSKIYKVKDGIIETIPIDINSDIVIQPWEAFWFQANIPNLTMNFHPAQNITPPAGPLNYTIGSPSKIDFISFPLVKKGTSLAELLLGTDFDMTIVCHTTRHQIHKMIDGVVALYDTVGTETAELFTVQAGRGYAIQHITAGSQLQIPTALMKNSTDLNETVKLQLSAIENAPGDYRTFNMLGNPFDYPIHLKSAWCTSNVYIELNADPLTIDGVAKISQDTYSDFSGFVRNMETMERWHIGLAVADSRGELADTFNEAGVISANGDVDRLIELYSAEDLILPGKNVRLVLRNPDQLDESKLCYDYRAGGQESYTWSIELSTTQQTIDAKLSLKNLAGIPADYQILITDPVTNQSIPVTSDTVLDVALSSQSPKTLVLTASRQKSTGVNELSRPAGIKINSIYPNPFNPQTTISFSTSLPGRVAVQVYSVNGQLVDTLADRNMSAGSHQINWDGAGHSSGVYIVKVNSGANTETKRMTLLK